MVKWMFDIDPTAPVPKYQQLINAVNEAIQQNVLKDGEILPSVNHVCEKCALSRDTVVKAYNDLKQQGVIQAVPNKGYFVCSSNERIFLLFDTFSAYKEELYDAFRQKLPANIEIDVYFHHYNINAFYSLINNSLGKYSMYVIMSYDDKRVNNVLEKIDHDKLLILDWDAFTPSNCSRIIQNFDQAFYECMETGLHLLKKYETINFVHPRLDRHPTETITALKRFCKTHNYKIKQLKFITDKDVVPGNVFVVISDNELVKIVEYCAKKNFTPGKEIGIISYNDTPMKKVVSDGITVISTNFRKMGEEAANFIRQKKKRSEIIPTAMIIRNSL